MRRYGFQVLLTAIVCLTNGAAAPDVRKVPEQVQAPKAVDLKEGYYLATGEVGRTTYEAIVSIKKIRDIYIVQWHTNKYHGPAQRVDDTLVIGFGNEHMRGVGIYQIQANGVLVGKWAALPGDGTWSEEKLEYLRGFKPAQVQPAEEP